MDVIIGSVCFILGFGSGFSLKLVIDRRNVKTSKTTVKLNHNVAGGDLAGRDISKKGER